jgi:hypothetical protein
MAAAAADHHRQLALEVEIRRDPRADHLAVVADKRVGQPQEHARLLGNFPAGFARVRAVVDAGAGDHVGVGNDRQEFDLGKRVVGPRVGGRLAHMRQKIAGKRLAQVGGAGAKQLVQRDDAVVGHHAECGLPVGDVACEFHRRPSPFFVRSRFRDVCAGDERFL